MPGSPERLQVTPPPSTTPSTETDLAVLATIEAYVEQVRNESTDDTAALQRLHAMEGRIQAIFDLATKLDGAAA